MSPMWIAASAVLVLAGVLVGSLAWGIAREVDRLTTEVVALRRTRAEVAALRRVDRRTVATGWVSDSESPR